MPCRVAKSASNRRSTRAGTGAAPNPPSGLTNFDAAQSLVHRLFVALRPPRSIRERLLVMMEGVPGARWQSDDQLHLTLRFIGEIDRHQGEDVAAALASIHAPAFDVALQGAGLFAPGSRAGALWIGVAPHAPLVALHQKIEGACRRAGLPPEGRAYLPHITVARLGRTAGPVEPFLQVAAAVASEPFTIDSFVLYESTLSPDGAHYHVVERYRLAARPGQPIEERGERVN